MIANTTPAELFAREDLSSAQQMLGSVAEDFMRTEVVAQAQRLHGKDNGLLRELILKAGELDLLRLDIPEEYGGLGLDKASSAYISEKIGILASFTVPFMVQTGIGSLPIVFFGTEEQKARYLPQLASGEKIAAYALTEPGAGTDALAARTKATLSGDGKQYILNGQKMWISNGGIADVFVVFAKVNGEKFTAFIVEREMGAVSGREEPKLGLDGSSTTALILENVRVPVGNVLGEVGQGHKVAFNILNFGRLKLGCTNLGAIKQALNDALQYALERHQFGRPIAGFGMIQQKLGEMAVRSYVADAVVYRTVGGVDRALAAGAAHDSMAVLKVIESFAAECSINKVFTSEALAYVVDEALQIYGGYGYSKDYPAERAYRDARISRIYEGTNEINRVLIPTRLLKDPEIANVAANLHIEANEARFSPSGDSLFASEYELLMCAKTIALLALGYAQALHGDELSNEQEILAYIADVIIDIYALESAVLRTRKVVNARGDSAGAVPIDIARVYATDAANRIGHSAKQVAAALAERGDTTALLKEIRRLGNYPTFNTVAARRRIASAILRAGRYPL